MLSSRSLEEGHRQENYGPGLKEDRTLFVRDVLGRVLWETTVVSKGGQEGPLHQGCPRV